MNGILYGVGVGPGNPKMLTLEAVEVLRTVDIIAVPDTSGEKTAMKIVEDYIKDKDILYCPMPMSRDMKLVEESHLISCNMLETRLLTGKNIAFITLGDPTIYSTYMSIQRVISAKGYTTKTIAGITSFCASAAALNISLCDRGEPLHIIPASYDDTVELLKLKGTKVLMKSGKSLGGLKETLKSMNLYENCQMVERCGMEDERVYRSLHEVSDEASYFSIIIVKDR
jgi:precorrin-2/cobalt-factor-2 C20-methyltransferase